MQIFAAHMMAIAHGTLLYGYEQSQIIIELVGWILFPFSEVEKFVYIVWGNLLFPISKYALFSAA